jgi:UDP-N-acetylmuramoyl-tripeptide--D-alanyl-D-alanine ligase
LGIDHVLTLGALARHTADNFPGARHFDTIEDLAVVVREALPGVNSILVKGSRFMRMERVVEALPVSASYISEAQHVD